MQDQATAVRRMSHTHDPHTSGDAAATVTVTKKELIYRAVTELLWPDPMTPGEVAVAYDLLFAGTFDYPDVDLQEIRRRMTEMQHDFGWIEPIQVGTQRGGKPQFATREGQRVMRLTVS